MGNSISKKPSNGQVVVVWCPDYCPEEYQIVTYDEGRYIREPNGDMTKWVKEWLPVKVVEDLF